MVFQNPNALKYYKVGVPPNGLVVIEFILNLLWGLLVIFVYNVKLYKFEYLEKIL